MITGADPERLSKGRAIAATPGSIEKIKDGVFSVKAQGGPWAYRVALNGESGRCSCPDFVERGAPCKHVYGVKLSESGPEPPTPPGGNGTVAAPYPQNSSAYDRAQMEEIRLFDVLLRDLVAAVPEPERDPHRAGRPPLSIQDQLFCAVQKVYSQMSCRRARGLFDNAVGRGQLPKAPHFDVSSKLFNRAEVTPLLQDLITKSALPMAAIENGFAPDSTGIRTTSFGAWIGEKHGDTREHIWLKAHALAGVKTHVVLRAIVTAKNAGDNPQFEPLIREAAQAGFPLKEVYADKAYSARSNYALAEEIGFDLFVPFKSNASGRPTSKGIAVADGKAHSILWRNAFLFFQMHREEFDAKYHRRSNVESVFSALKRKFGETLRSKNQTAQVNELLAKILAYNLTVLIHEIFEHGVVPDFLGQTPAAKSEIVSENLLHRGN
ncbi:MAG: transposase [Thermoplasmata archaeon]